MWKISRPKARQPKARATRVPALMANTSASPYFCRAGPVPLNPVEAVEAAFELAHHRRPGHETSHQPKDQGAVSVL